MRVAADMEFAVAAALAVTIVVASKREPHYSMISCSFRRSSSTVLGWASDKLKELEDVIRNGR